MQIRTYENRRETKSHGGFAFPLLVSRESINAYEFDTFSWHWHPEIELTLIEEGEMCYQVNGASYHLRQGDLLFGNANTLHSGHGIDGGPCLYTSITFDPKLIYGFEKSRIQMKYVTGILCDPALCALHFDGSRPWHKELTEAVRRLIHLSEEKPDFYELQMQMVLSGFWLLLLTHPLVHTEEKEALKPKELSRLKEILAFVHENYEKKISLEDIAGSVHICKSECCRFFKKHMGESLFDYLLRYRVEQSLKDLQSEESSITEAALRAGFGDPGYYSKVFRRYMGRSPREYRKEREEMP